MIYLIHDGESLELSTLRSDLARLDIVFEAMALPENSLVMIPAQARVVAYLIRKGGVLQGESASRLLTRLQGRPLLCLAYGDCLYTAETALSHGAHAFLNLRLPEASASLQSWVSQGAGKPVLKSSPPLPLTGQQGLILRYLAVGFLDKQIADILHIVPKTVAYHKAQIQARLALSTIHECISWAALHLDLPHRQTVLAGKDKLPHFLQRTHTSPQAAV